MDYILKYKQQLKPFGFLAATVIGLYGITVLFKNSDEDQQQEGIVSRKPAGIQNQGNTCFVNSLLQALASIDTFRINIQNLLKIKNFPDDHQQLMIQLSKVIKKINSNNQFISVSNFLEILARTQKDLINFQQQDAHQLFGGIVNTFQEFYNKRKNVSLSFSTNLQQFQLENNLVGYTKSSIVCTTCNTTVTHKNIQTTIKIHGFYDLSLQIEPKFIQSLQTALLWFQRKQKIENYTCTKCSIDQHFLKLQRLMKRIEGQHKQDLLEIIQKIIVYLKKSNFEDMDLEEINKRLSEFVTDFKPKYDEFGQKNRYRNEVFSLIKSIGRDIIKQTKIIKYPKIIVIHFKQMIINPYTGQPQLMKKTIDFKENLQFTSRLCTKSYQLTSLLTHIGNQQMGHYFTFRKKNRFERDWYMISDSHTQKVQAKRLKRYVPYMLFYELDSQVFDQNHKKNMSRSLNLKINSSNIQEQESSQYFVMDV